MKFTSPIVQEEYLLHATPESVYHIIQEAYVNRKSRLDDVLPDGLSRKLLNRNESLINLALAEYSNDDDILQELFDKGSRAIRIAVLSNTNENFWPRGRKWLTEEKIKAVCNDSNEAHAYFSNKLIAGHDLQAVFLREGFYSDLSDQTWREILYYAFNNPNVKTRKKEDPYATDGWEDYTDSLPRCAAWGLLDSMEVTFANARMLNYAFYETGIPFELPVKIKAEILTDGAKTSEALDQATLEFFQRVLGNWSARNCKDESAYDDGKESFIFETLREGIASSAPTYHKSVLNFMKTHQDVYVRKGYYRLFNPLKADEIEELFRKDGKYFLDAAILNHNLYEIKPIDVRKAFHRIVNYSRDEYPEIEFDDRQRIREIYDIKAEELSNINSQRYCQDPNDYADEEIVSTGLSISSLNDSAQQIHEKISEMSKKLSDRDPRQSDFSEILKMLSKLQADSLQVILARIELTENHSKKMFVWLIIILLIMMFFMRR